MTGLIYYSDDMRHLICIPYSIANLHRMADDLSIKRCWFHRHPLYPHYDLPKRRIAEIQAKTKVIPARMLLEMIKVELAEKGGLTGLKPSAILSALKRRDEYYESKSRQEIQKASRGNK
jgi:hypothetical protein